MLEYTKYGYDDDIETTWLELLESLYGELERAIPNIGSSEIKIDANQYLKRLGDTIKAIRTRSKKLDCI